MKKIISMIIAASLIVFTFSCGKKETSVGTKTFDVSKNYKIYISSSVDNTEFDAMRKGFVVGLKDLGLVEDINVTYYYENAKGNESYARQIADAFKEKNPDLLVTIGSTATEAIKEKFDKTPIVYLAVSNAERLGYCDADGNPKGNLTGVIDSQLFEEQLDFIQKNYTDVKRLGIIYTSGNNLSEFFIDYFKFYADDVQLALNNILPKVDAITLIPDNIVDTKAKEVVDAVKASNKEVFGMAVMHKSVGANVAVERDYRLVGEKAAVLAKEILVDGKKVSDVKTVKEDFKIN